MPTSLNEDERFPLLDERGRQTLRFLQEHPSAPRFNDRCGDYLTLDDSQQVQEFEQQISFAPNQYRCGEIPDWLNEFGARCCADVPFFRRYGSWTGSFFDLPTTSRADLSPAPWDFAPDSLPLDDLVLYRTSGSTGHPLQIISHPAVASMHIPLIRAALAQRGVTWPEASRRVAMAMVCFQKTTVTCVSISTYLGQAGFIKVNLDPGDWRSFPGDAVGYLDACSPQVYSGDPLSFAELMRLPLQTRPDALVSTSMTLTPAFHRELEAHFGCPVIDLYSLNESGPIAAGIPGEQIVLPHPIYVEILDPTGKPCAPGIRGEITVSGGFNPYLPLLRYRTGDWGSLMFRGQQPVLMDLEGRQPVRFRSSLGQPVHNIDVSIALRPFALPQYTLHQAADGSLLLSVAGSPDTARLRQALLGLFGANQTLTIMPLPVTSGEKIRQYSSDWS